MAERQRPIRHTLYTVWGYTQTDPTLPLLLCITPEVEFASHIRRLAWATTQFTKVTIDRRQVPPTGLRSFMDTSGKADVKIPLTDGQILDLVQEQQQ